MEEWQRRRCLRSGNGKPERFRIKPSGGAASSIHPRRLLLRPVNSRRIEASRQKVLTSSTRSPFEIAVSRKVDDRVANFCESYAEFCSVPTEIPRWRRILLDTDIDECKNPSTLHCCFFLHVS